MEWSIKISGTDFLKFLHGKFSLHTVTIRSIMVYFSGEQVVGQICFFFSLSLFPPYFLTVEKLFGKVGVLELLDSMFQLCLLLIFLVLFVTFYFTCPWHRLINSLSGLIKTLWFVVFVQILHHGLVPTRNRDFSVGETMNKRNNGIDI